MRTDELRSVLHEHGDRVEDAGAHARVTAVHQRVTTVRRRRAAVAGGGLVAAVAAVALAVVPNLDPNPETGPAAPGGGYSKGGVTFPAEAGDLQLIAASIGGRGQSELTFEAAVPDPGTLLQLSPICYGPAADDYAVSMSINGTLMYGTSCGTDRPEDPGAPGTSSGEEIADALETLELEPGRPMQVRVWLRSRTIDENDAVTHPRMVVGGAVYGEPLDEAGGYTKDGVTFRPEVLGERLLGAAIGDRGEPAVSFDVVVPDSGLRFSPLCYGVGPEYLVRTEIDGQGVSGTSCHEPKVLDPGAHGSTFDRPLAILREWGLEPGDTATVTVRLEAAYGDEGPVQRDAAVIGAGVYEDSRPTHRVGGVELPDQVEHDGRTWELASTYESGEGARAVRIGHDPTDEPELLVGAVSGLRAPGAYSFALDGVEQTSTEMGAGGPTWEILHVFESGEGGLADLKVTRGLTVSTRVSLVAYKPIG